MVGVFVAFIRVDDLHVSAPINKTIITQCVALLENSLS